MTRAACRDLTEAEAGALIRRKDDDCLIDLELSRQDLIYMGLIAYAFINRNRLGNLARQNPQYLLAAPIVLPLLIELLGGDDDRAVIDLCLDMQDIIVLGGLTYAAVTF